MNLLLVSLLNTVFWMNRSEDTIEQKPGLVIWPLFFTIIAILITCIGLFGLASHTAQRKTKEIGVRKVFGSSVGNVICSIC